MMPRSAVGTREGAGNAGRGKAVAGIVVLWAALLTGSASYATSEMVWRPAPPSSPGAAGEVHRSHGRRSQGDVFFLSGSRGSELSLWTPTLKVMPLTADLSGRVEVPPTGIDYYYLLVAERDVGARHETALRYFHRFGRPGGHSPSELTAAKKMPLEIVPSPLPREHQRYLTGEAARFRIRYEGKPLSDANMTLSTSNGTTATYTADARGVATVMLPDDFKHVVAGREHNRPAEFMLRVEQTDSGKRFVTTLSGAYHVNPSHWQSTIRGAWVVIAGFFTGVAVVGVQGRRSAGRRES